MIVNDILNELSGIGDDCWADSIEIILKILDFPIYLNYSCGWEEFIYGKSGKLQYINNRDKIIISQCCGIALYNFTDKWYKRKLIAVNLKGSKRKKVRNEIACNIYKCFRKLYGYHLFFIIYYNDEISFLGTVVHSSKRNEIIISDWFGKYTDLNTLERIEEIDFVYFSDSNIEKLYSDYLWAIARPYIRYPECKMFLTFGCGYIQNFERWVSGLPIADQEEIFYANSSYYKNIYGEDYFEDNVSINEEDFDYVEDNISDLEWTMLEMDLKAEMANDKSEEDVASFKGNDNIAKNVPEEISDMNPAEMLQYIQDKSI